MSFNELFCKYFYIHYRSFNELFRKYKVPCVMRKTGPAVVGVGVFVNRFANHGGMPVNLKIERESVKHIVLENKKKGIFDILGVLCKVEMQNPSTGGAQEAVWVV